jgi:hypothetical protein
MRQITYNSALQKLNGLILFYCFILSGLAVDKTSQLFLYQSSYLGEITGFGIHSGIIISTAIVLFMLVQMLAEIASEKVERSNYSEDKKQNHYSGIMLLEHLAFYFLLGVVGFCFAFQLVHNAGIGLLHIVSLTIITISMTVLYKNREKAYNRMKGSFIFVGMGVILGYVSGVIH